MGPQGLEPLQSNQLHTPWEGIEVNELPGQSSLPPVWQRPIYLYVYVINILVYVWYMLPPLVHTWSLDIYVISFERHGFGFCVNQQSQPRLVVLSVHWLFCGKPASNTQTSMGCNLDNRWMGSTWHASSGASFACQVVWMCTTTEFPDSDSDFMVPRSMSTSTYIPYYNF